MKIREYFVSVKERLEEYNDKLREELKNADEEIEKGTQRSDCEDLHCEFRAEALTTCVMCSEKTRHVPLSNGLQQESVCSSQISWLRSFSDNPYTSLASSDKRPTVVGYKSSSMRPCEERRKFTHLSVT